jgi:acid phosphatase family membrane protein YuiD
MTPLFLVALMLLLELKVTPTHAFLTVILGVVVGILITYVIELHLDS